MAKLRIAIATALGLFASVPVSAAPARDVECFGTLAQRTEALRILEAKAAEVAALAEHNPLYKSDVAYYASVLQDARQCLRGQEPLVAASR